MSTQCTCQGLPWLPSTLSPGGKCFVHAAVLQAGLPAAEAIEINQAMERIYDIHWESPDAVRG